MKDGFLEVAAATLKVRVADPQYNARQIMDLIGQGYGRGMKLMVFPELCLIAYTCVDLFGQKALLRRAKEELGRIIRLTDGKDILVFLGLPWEWDGKLYNAAAAIRKGRLTGVVPKRNPPNYSEFYEARNFCPGNEWPVMTCWNGEKVPMGTNLLFRCNTMPEPTVAAEIYEDVWVPCPPSIRHVPAEATVVVNCSASDETTGKDMHRHDLICSRSARPVCGCVHANAGKGESTQDLVFGSQNTIAENGTCLMESKRLINESICADMDLERLDSKRRRMSTFPNPAAAREEGGYLTVEFSFDAVSEDSAGSQDTQTHGSTQPGDDVLRYVDPVPFVPRDERQRNKRCEEILSIQAMGLEKRLEHTGCYEAVIGLSGGLDSILTLLVTVRAFDSLRIPRSGIHCITMSCFGTTDRTYNNAYTLAEKVGAKLNEINIREAVTRHFEDIGHDMDKRDVTYENSQAREKTQVLMDIANEVGGLVIGTGDMPELALGRATYNGDHMPMYGVNGSIPKTLVRHLVRHYADAYNEKELADVLLDVLDTPVSPELLSPKDSQISQKTEDLVGPHELHDLYLYYIPRYGYAPFKVYRLAIQAFKSRYDRETILKWLNVFYRCFFSQQFKCFCLPDGPKVGSVAVSPRGDLRMPSDASGRVWLEELEGIK